VQGTSYRHESHRRAIVLGAGQTDQSNTGDGITLFSSNNTVGGTAAERATSSRHRRRDLHQKHHRQRDPGNSIGTDATGTINLGNAYGAGVRIDGGTDNTIGGTASGG
jgi:hypothetical protein